MNREIEFRAWDKDGEKFSSIALGYALRDINYYTDYVWEQYTGLKDKNGVKIFEGDILRLDWIKRSYINPVKFSYGRFELDLNIPLSETFSAHSEILGNIHQNPELLQD